MNVKKNRNIIRVVLAGACAVALTVGTAVPAFAENQTGKHPIEVSYDLATVIPGTHGWGLKIPKSIPFGNDITKTVDVPISLYNMTDGDTIDNISLTGTAQIDMVSENGFNLRYNGGDDVGYKLTFTGGDIPDNAPVVFEKGTTKTKIGGLSKAKPSFTGTALRTGDATAAGLHTDHLTFYYNDDDAGISNTQVPAQGGGAK